MKAPKFKVWRMYVKFMLRQHPDKNLKWLLQVYHKKHPEEYEEFKKNPKRSV